MSSQADSVYKELLERATRLDPEQQLLLLEELAALVRRRVTDREKERSILELKGLGKALWGGVDAGEYVERERASWNG